MGYDYERPSRAISQLRDEVNAVFPTRSKISDGILGDPAHAARTSDHNPDINGLVHAWDCTKDDRLNVAQVLHDFLIETKDPRVKYFIWEGRITSGKFGPSPWLARNYTGPNGHYHHLHLSVLGDHGSPWGFAEWYNKKINPTSPIPTPESDDTVSPELEKMIREIHADLVEKKEGNFRHQITKRLDAFDVAVDRIERIAKKP